MLLNCGFGKDLRVPWTARRFNQFILKEICPEYSLEGLMLKRNSKTFATCWEELTPWKRPWCWERLKWEEKGMTEDEMIGRHHHLMDMSLSKLLEVMDREAWRAAVHGVTESWTWLSERTELNWVYHLPDADILIKSNFPSYPHSLLLSKDFWAVVPDSIVL